MKGVRPGVFRGRLPCRGFAKALARKVGARAGLRMILEELMLDLMYPPPQQQEDQGNWISRLKWYRKRDLSVDFCWRKAG